MIILYHRTDCPFCWKVRLGLDELGIDYSIVNTRLGEKHPDVVRYNPKGSVPVLIDGEAAIWESNAILEYLDEKARKYEGLPCFDVSGDRVEVLEKQSS